METVKEQRSKQEMKIQRIRERKFNKQLVNLKDDNYNNKGNKR